jgi:hypothetical protein
MAQAELGRKEEIYDKSNELFEKTIGYFQGGYYSGMIHEILARIHYADSLIEQGDRERSLEQLRQAKETVTKIGNLYEKNRIEKMMNLILTSDQSDSDSC